MRNSGWTPSIVPNGDDQTFYLVKDDLGRLGAVWREADAETTDIETVITDLLTGQYSDPVKVIAFNTAERPATFPKTSPTSYAGAAICRCGTCRQAL